MAPVVDAGAEASGRLDVLLAGYGTVGQAVHRALEEHRGELTARGVDARVTAIARRERTAIDADGIAYPEANGLAWEPGELMDAIWEAEADVLVEATPTDLVDGQPALGHVRTALHNDMGVVLANKGPLAHAYHELEDRAREAGVPLRFEATVGACIPAVNAARHAFAGDRVQRVEGILNGTTNFVLTRMSEEGSELEQALRETQALGYAEADPSADLEGLDAAAKIVILANALLDRELTLEDVDVEGIRDLPRNAVELAGQHGKRLKLVAEADREGTVRVGPSMVPKGDPLDVPGALNAVRFTTELAGSRTHTGAGAGGGPTAAAIVSDLVEVARELGER